MVTATNTQILTLTQWLSPAYPIGAFTYSHGLEAATDQGWVTDADSLEAWLEDVLEHGAGRSDALLIAAAYLAESPTELQDIDGTARAFAASKERLFEGDQQGASFARVTNTIWGGDLTGLTYAVALGAASRRADLPLSLTQTLYLQAFLSNLVAAGQRLAPIGQTAGQQIIQRQSARLSAIVDATSHGDLTQLSSTAFLGDIASMKHETQYSRIFRT
jgi:urease accessory protein